jgi:hypothetical protein
MNTGKIVEMAKGEDLFRQPSSVYQLLLLQSLKWGPFMEKRSLQEGGTTFFFGDVSSSHDALMPEKMPGGGTRLLEEEADHLVACHFVLRVNP